MTRKKPHLAILPAAIIAPVVGAALFALINAYASPIEQTPGKVQAVTRTFPATVAMANPLPSGNSAATEVSQQTVGATQGNQPAPMFTPNVTAPNPESADDPCPNRKLNKPRKNALGMIETGNDDRAVGSAGEISRFQIMPSVWKHYSDSRQYRDPEISLEVAQQHWAWLYDYFKKQARREPTDFDMYVLWNTRHGHYATRGFQPSRLSAVVRDRAQRFSNLVRDAERREAAAAPITLTGSTLETNVRDDRGG